MKSTLFLTLAGISLFSNLTIAAAPPLPPAPRREAMLKAMAAEMERLDGEALMVRARNRALGFENVVASLASEAAAADSWPRLLRAFARLDAAYPNLHSRFAPGDWFDAVNKRPVPELRFTAEWLANGKITFRLVNGAHTPMESSPRAGDQLVEINGRGIEEWRKENLEFCKFPLQEQCDLELYSNFRSELLSWNREQPLAYTLERDGAPFSVNVAVSEQPRPPRKNSQCWEDEKLYAGFTMVHSGRFACLFTKNSDPSRVILRIASFQYHRADGNHPIRSVQQEVDALWPWWQKNASGISSLVIDLAGNGGGNEPVPWYEILFDRPFQEQWYRFKKIPEFADETLRKQTLFWGTPQQEIWYQNLRRSGEWDRVPFGGFLPALPMFCAGDEASDCREGRFPVRGHGFHGKVVLLLNQWCVSSCDGFAYAVKDQLGERVRVAGHPQAADTAYSRVMIQLKLDERDPRGFRTLVENHQGNVKIEALFTQTVTVGRSVTEAGEIVSGFPLVLDTFVPIAFFEGESAWRAGAVKRLVE